MADGRGAMRHDFHILQWACSLAKLGQDSLRDPERITFTILDGAIAVSREDG